MAPERIKPTAAEERVARALAAKSRPGRAIGADHWEPWLAHARVAIAAMADPHTDLMRVPTSLTPLSRDIVKAIAMDIGKAVASHIETLYPEAVAATSKSMLLSVRNTTHNQIMSMLDISDEDAIRQRLAQRRQWRMRQRAAYRRLRDQPETEDQE